MEEVKMTFHQVMIFMNRITEIKKDDKNFSDPITLNFEDFVMERTIEIARISPIILKLRPSLGMYKFSKRIYEYLKKITGVDPFDKETYDRYLPILKRKEEESFEKFMDELKRK